MSEVEKLRALLREAAPWMIADAKLNDGYAERVLDLHGRIVAMLAEPAKADPTLTVREACRRRMPLDGTDAQALEHAITITERERDAARAEVAVLQEELRFLREEAIQAAQVDARKKGYTEGHAAGRQAAYDGDVTNADLHRAFERGAEAMREAATRLAYAQLAHTLTDVHEKIRALPIPGDKR